MFRSQLVLLLILRLPSALQLANGLKDILAETPNCWKRLPFNPEASSVYEDYDYYYDASPDTALPGRPQYAFHSRQEGGTFPWWQAEIGSCAVLGVTIKARKVRRERSSYTGAPQFGSFTNINLRSRITLCST